MYLCLSIPRLQESRVAGTGHIFWTGEPLNCDHPSPNNIEVVRSIQRTSATGPVESNGKNVKLLRKSYGVVYLSYLFIVV